MKIQKSDQMHEDVTNGVVPGRGEPRERLWGGGCSLPGIHGDTVLLGSACRMEKMVENGSPGRSSCQGALLEGRQTGGPHVSRRHGRIHENLKFPWPRASLVAQWLRIRLPTQGTRVRSLVREDPTCHGATKPAHHNY